MPDYEPNPDYDSLFDDGGYVSRNEAKRLAREEFQKILTDVNVFSTQAAAGVQNAIREISSKHPDFEEQRSRMLAVLERIPLLKQAVASAESNPQLSASLPEMYETLYQAAHGPAGSTAVASAEPSKSSVLDTRPSALADEGTQYQAALASQRVDLSPGGRKALIAELEKRGVGDIEF